MKASCLLAFAVALPLVANAEPLHATYEARYISCHDGDTCRFEVPIWPGIIAISNVRFRGLDTPELQARCPLEAQLAVAARDLVRARLVQADTITLSDVEPDLYDRMLATVRVDSQDLSGIVITAGLGRAYNGGKRKGWCDA